MGKIQEQGEAPSSHSLQRLTSSNVTLQKLESQLAARSRLSRSYRLTRLATSRAPQLFSKLPPRAAPSASPGPAPKRARFDANDDEVEERPQASSAAGPSRVNGSAAAGTSALEQDDEAERIVSGPDGGEGNALAGPSNASRVNGAAVEQERLAGASGSGSGRQVATASPRRREGMMMMGLDDGAEEDSEPEPDTEESEAEDTPRRSSRRIPAVEHLRPPQVNGHSQGSASGGAAPGSSSSPQPIDRGVGRAPLQNGARIATPIVDLTDSNDEDENAPPPRAAAAAAISASTSFATLPELTNGTSAASASTTSSFTKDQKGKGKARAISSPPPPAPPKADDPPAPSLSTLTCPVCLGPPTPLVLTACGHAFCGPCLHASLAAGPALTPPPADLGPGTRGTRGRGGAAAQQAAQQIFVPTGGARARGARGRGRGTGGPGDGRADEPPGDLDKHCPVCRAPLRGGVSRFCSC